MAQRPPFTFLYEREARRRVYMCFVDMAASQNMITEFNFTLKCHNTLNNFTK